MATALKTVVLLVANPALSSILSMTLAGSPVLRVRPFETVTALKTYLQLAPADLVVVDFDGLSSQAQRLREDASIPSTVRIIALASDLSADVRAAGNGGIDEIILKPMSPRYLVERVLARLARPRPLERRRLYRRDWSKFGDNVVPLFSADRGAEPLA